MSFASRGAPRCRGHARGRGARDHCGGGHPRACGREHARECAVHGHARAHGHGHVMP